MREFSVFLFDIDGVLVAPYGYRAAVRATLGYFFQQMKLPDSLLPDNNVLSGFEAIRITSEWDMVPICLAAVIDSWMALNPEISLGDQLTEAIQQIGQSEPSTHKPGEINYLGLLRFLKDRLQTDKYPADVVLQLAMSEAGASLFTRLTGHGLLNSLLGHSRDLEYSLTTRLFQHYTLGSKAFETSYQRPASIQTDSLLASLDRPQLSKELSQQILIKRRLKELYPAAFTLRSSLAPRGVDDHLPLKYVPEAEIALEQVQLTEIPIIGYGRILYLADKFDLEPENLMKPSPVQAIAAILAAISDDESLALRLAYNAYAKSEAFPNSLLSPGDRLQVHVFEDSAGGIEAVYRAAELFSSHGFVTNVHAYGIASHPEKIAALEQVGALLFPSTNQAIHQALKLHETG